MGQMKRYELLLRELPSGSKIEARRVAGSGRGSRKTGHHPVIHLPDGTILRDDRGLPLTVPFSPSDHHSMRNCLARVRRVLRERGLA